MKLMPCVVVLFSGAAASAASATELEGMDETVKAMKEELGEKFIVETVEPFVVATDDGASAMRSYKGTIQRCTEALYDEFFDARPAVVIKVYLLKDDKSYEAFVKRTEGHEPSTPFGFCTDGGAKLVMNIGTGGGTLVHEMVHAFIKPDFPRCPTWLNEGLASLFEQCTTAEGKIRGLVNWRLPGLQKALEEKKFVKFGTLMRMSEGEFYGRDSGSNYAEARYLCMYMQEKGVLAKFYEKFRDSMRPVEEKKPEDKKTEDGKPVEEKPTEDKTAEPADPTGFKIFQALWDKPVEEVEGDFQKWVKGLKWH